MFGFGEKEEVSGLQVFLEALGRLLLVDFPGVPTAAPHRVFEKVEGEWVSKPLPRNPAAAALAAGGGGGKVAVETKVFHNASFSRQPVKGRVWEPPPWSPDGDLGNRIHICVADRYPVGLFGAVWVVRDCTTVVVREHNSSYIIGVARILSEVRAYNAYAPGAKTLNPKLERFLEKFEEGQAELKPKPKKPKPKPKPRQGQRQGQRQRQGQQRRNNQNRR